MADEERASKRRKGKQIIPPEKTIKLKLNLAGFLKESLNSLSDPEFNPVRIAMVQITPRGLEITAKNEETNVVATIFFKSSEMTYFRCVQSLPPHMMFLDRIVSFLSDVDDDATVKIFHVVGADRPRLFFKVKYVELNVDLMKFVNANPPRFPYGLPDCTAPITSTILNELIAHLKDNSHLVSVKVKREHVVVSIGVDELSDDWKRWTISCGRVKTQWGMKHHAIFDLPYLESMKKASLLDPDPVLYFLSQPENHIAMQFRLEGHGEMLFFFKAEMMDTALDTDSSSGDTSEASQSGGDASENSQSGVDAAEASQAGGDAAEASQAGGDAAEASQSNNNAAEASQPGGDAAEPAFERRKGKEIAETAKTEKTIKLKLIPVAFLRISLESFNDSELNPFGIAMVEITDRGLQITVQNEETGVAATIIFTSSNLLEFRCIRPLLPHMILLDQIIEFLINVPDDETITIFHFDNSEDPRLFFKFKPESDLVFESNLSLMEVTNANPQRVQRGVPVCSALIRSKVLIEMIQHLKNKPQLVSVEVKRDLVIFSIGLDELPDKCEKWRIYCANVTTQRGMKHHAMFKLPCLESMRRVSSLDANPVMYFESQPENHITMQFCPGIGEILFLLKAEILDMAPDMDSLSGDASEAPQPGDDAAVASQPDSDASEASRPGGGASETSRPGIGASEASQPGVDATEASQPDSDASEASQPHDGAAEISQKPNDDAAAAS